MRARNIKPGFFKNEDLGSGDPLAQLLFAGLWGLADRNGVLEDRPLRIKAEVFPFRDADVDDLLDQLAAMTSHDSTPLVIRYLASGKPAIFLPGFVKHQMPHHRESAGDLAPPAGPVDTVSTGKQTLPSAKEVISSPLNVECGILNQQQQHESPAAAAANSDVAEQVAALVKQGLSPTLAQRHVAETADPALIREILRYHQAHRKALRNPLGALRSMLKDPTSWGFERTERGWQGPAPPAGKVDVADKVAQARREISDANMRRMAANATTPQMTDAEWAEKRRKAQEAGLLRKKAPP